MTCHRCGEDTTRFTLSQRYCPPCQRDADRIAAIQPVPEAPDRRPAWLRNLRAADKTEWSPR